MVTAKVQKSKGTAQDANAQDASAQKQDAGTYANDEKDRGSSHADGRKDGVES
jgi:hypothetical protein